MPKPKVSAARSRTPHIESDVAFALISPLAQSPCQPTEARKIFSSCVVDHPRFVDLPLPANDCDVSAISQTKHLNREKSSVPINASSGNILWARSALIL